MRAQHRLGSASCILPHSLTHVGTQIRQVNLFALPPSLPWSLLQTKPTNLGCHQSAKSAFSFGLGRREKDLNLTQPNTVCLSFTYVATFGSLYLPLPLPSTSASQLVPRSFFRPCPPGVLFPSLPTAFYTPSLAHFLAPTVPFPPLPSPLPRPPSSLSRATKNTTDSPPRFSLCFPRYPWLCQFYAHRPCCCHRLTETL
jgi:hypothetical protein